MNEEIRAYLRDLGERVRGELNDRVVGLYAYGSLTMDAFVPGKSDVDVVAVVRDPLGEGDRLRLGPAAAGLPLPAAARGLDLTAVAAPALGQSLRRCCWEAVVQVSRTDRGQESRERERCDPRLPLDLALLRQDGLTVFGARIEELLPPVPRGLVLAACRANARIWAGRDVLGDPSSGILNVCRAWRYAAEGSLASKPEAGAWARENGAPSGLIDSALRCWRGDDPWPPGLDAAAKQFLRDTLERLEQT